jgi:hypothetical protein
MGCQGELAAWKNAAPGARRGGVRMPEMIGSVTRERYDELVQLSERWTRRSYTSWTYTNG